MANFAWLPGETLGERMARIEREQYYERVIAPLEAERDRLKAENERLRGALRVCREAFRTTNVSNGAIRSAESVLASALASDETDAAS